MESLLCQVCFYEYSYYSNRPLVLGCGHTFCLSCIKTTIKTPYCPTCRIEFKRETFFPANYFILSFLEECCSTKYLSQQMENRIQNLKEKLKSRLEIVQKEMLEISENHKLLQEDLKTLESIEGNNKKEEFGKLTIQQELNILEKRLQELQLTNLAYFDDPDLFATFSLKEKTKEDFLNEIYKTLKTERVFSFKWIEKKLKVGELTIRDNKMLIHSLTVDDFPKDSKTVSFDNLKAAITGTHFNIFMIISWRNHTSHLVIIKLHDPKLSPNLIKLCTGECGLSYKNCSFQEVQESVTISNEDSNSDQNLDSQSGSNVAASTNYTDNFPFSSKKPPLFNNYGNGFQRQCFASNEQKKGIKNKEKTQTLLSGIGIDISEDFPTDYYKNIPSSVLCESLDVALTPKDNDGFNLMLISTAQKYEVLGKVIYPSDICNHIKNISSDCKILDCGLVYEL